MMVTGTDRAYHFACFSFSDMCGRLVQEVCLQGDERQITVVMRCWLSTFLTSTSVATTRPQTLNAFLIPQASCQFAAKCAFPRWVSRLFLTSDCLMFESVRRLLASLCQRIPCCHSPEYTNNIVLLQDKAVLPASA